MIKLHIKQPGILLRLTQFRQNLRTPVELDVSKCNIDRLIYELRQQYNINDFELKTVKEHDNNIKNTNDGKNDLISVDYKLSEQLEKLTEKLDKVADILINREPMKEVYYKEQFNGEGSNKQEKSKANKIKEEEDFIPNVDLGGFKQHGTTPQKIEDKKDDTSEKADSLSKLSRRKK